MWHLSKLTPLLISSSSHCFWSSGDMSITRSRGCTLVKRLSVFMQTHQRECMNSDFYFDI
jgi:hypothetical protein